MMCLVRLPIMTKTFYEDILNMNKTWQELVNKRKLLSVYEAAMMQSWSIGISF